jgi:transmembrane sensor
MSSTPKNPLTEPNQPSEDAVNDQASEWFAKVHRGNMSAAERSRFRQWLSTNPRHDKAYKETEAFWCDSDFQTALTTLPLSQELVIPSLQNSRNKPWIVLAIAACLMLMAILLRPMLGCLQADYCTGTGEIREVKLADGSTVTLSPQTAIKIAMNTELRQVQLLEGEAFFSVQRNPARPFVVASQYSQTRVLGTQFNVKDNTHSDTITVISGVVEVSHNRQQPSILHANDSISVSDNQTGSIETSSGNAASAWTKGHLVFANATLKEVIGELGRYRQGAVIIKNNRMKALKVNGRFDIRDTDKALDALEQTLPVHIYRLSPWLVLIA